MIDNKCLTSDISGNSVYFDDCKGEKNQVWQLYDDKIKPLYQKEKCLGSHDEHINIEKCTNDDSQMWNIEQPDVDKSTDYRLGKYKGKMVVLVDSDNPWYLNSDTTIPTNYYKGLNMTEKGFRNDADFGSYENKEFENFCDDTTNDNNAQTHVIVLLFLIIIILIAYKFFVNKTSSASH